MDAPVREGEILAGKYRVERVLGVGGMGVVVAAHHLALDRRVAIKFLLPEATTNAEVVARFAREARAAVRIDSEHVARVIDVGAMDSGAPYMVMEYLVGSDLAHRVAEHGALPIEEAVDYLLQACEAIAEAHAAGIVHRDLKPANLFLTRRADGSSLVKVLDFGISKAIQVAGSQPDMSLTKTASVMGSPLYMAPEQMRSTRSVDARADIWALGIILYELVSGKVPFEATTMPELCAMVLTETPPPLREHRPDAPLGLWTIIERCLQKDPAQRYGNISELANALVSYAPPRSQISAERISRVLRAAGIDTQSVRPPASAAAASASRVGDSTDAAWSPSTTGGARGVSKWAVGGGVVAALLLGCAALVFALRPVEPQHGEAASPAAAPAAASPAAAPVAVAAALTAEPAQLVPAPAPSASTAASSAPPKSAPAAAKVATHRAVAKAAPVPAAAPAPVAAPAPAAPAPKKNPLSVGLK